MEIKPVSGYEVQKKPRRGDWTKARTGPVGGDATSVTVPDLPEGQEFEFRVVAVNDAGPGKPSKSTGPHKIRDPICKFSLALYLCRSEEICLQNLI